MKALWVHSVLVLVATLMFLLLVILTQVLYNGCACEQMT